LSTLCVSELKDNLDYCSDTGLFTRRIAKSNHPKAQVGMVAGRKTTDGYITISINNVEYLAHRLAWLYVHGELPDTGIDHKDLDKANNRISNLRTANKSQNAGNCGIYSHNTSGVKGVGWHKSARKWRVHIGNSHIGLFTDMQDAIDARYKAEKEYFGEFARHSNAGLT